MRACGFVGPLKGLPWDRAEEELQSSASGERRAVEEESVGVALEEKMVAMRSSSEDVQSQRAWGVDEALLAEVTVFEEQVAFLTCFSQFVLKNVVIFPSKAVPIANALQLFSPCLAIVDEHLTRHLPRQWLTSLKIEKQIILQGMYSVIEAPRQSDLMIGLIKKLKPQVVVVTGIAHFEAVTTSAFEHLLNITGKIGSCLFLDISDHFELSSIPVSNGVLKYLSGTSLPSHAAVICGLVKNQVFTDLEVAFVISEEEAIFKALSKTVELLEGNTALISQYYYGCLFREILAFQLAD